MRVLEVGAVAQGVAELFEGQVRGEPRPRTRREVPGNERTELGATREVARSIDLFRLAHEGVAPFGVRRRRVAVVAAALRVDNVAAEADEGWAQPAEIQRHRGDLEPAPDPAVDLPVRVEVVGLTVP